MAQYANRWGPEDVNYAGSRKPARLTTATVYFPGTETLVPLYADAERTAQATNPVLTDSLGNLTFWVNPGEYEVEINEHRFPVSIGLHPLEPVSGGGGAVGYQHIQTIPATEWTIPHNMGRPAAGCSVKESTGDWVLCGMETNTPVVTILSFDAPTSGEANLI